MLKTLIKKSKTSNVNFYKCHVSIIHTAVFIFLLFVCKLFKTVSLSFFSFLVGQLSGYQVIFIRENISSSFLRFNQKYQVGYLLLEAQQNFQTVLFAKSTMPLFITAAAMSNCSINCEYYQKHKTDHHIVGETLSIVFLVIQLRYILG